MARNFTLSALVLTLALSTASLAAGQAAPTHFRFNSGQSIQPFFDGWTHNDDGSFEFHFAYLNRNYVEEIHVPVGENNHVSPGDPDQGQPTYFYPRQHSRMFSVTVPADFGDGEVVWEITVHGETYRAVGWLLPEWEIDLNPFANRTPPDVLAANQAPSLTVASSVSGSAGSPITIEASVSDDGLPPPREFRGGAGNPTPTFEPVDDGPTLPINVPQVQNQSRHRPTRSRADGVNITWTQIRGPIGARIETSEDVASVVATFEAAGAYLFRVQASDGPASVTELIEVTVR